MKPYQDNFFDSGIAVSAVTPLRLIKNTEVTFNFTCNTKFGERVGLIGSMQLLGHWDIAKAVPLNTSPQTYPVWTIRIDLPRDKIVEYKYVIIQDGKQGVKTKVNWEILPPNINRIANTFGKKESVIYESLGSLEIMEEYIEVAKQEKYMSSSDFDSLKNEDFETGNQIQEPSRFMRKSTRKLPFVEGVIDDIYQDSDSVKSDENESPSTKEKIEMNQLTVQDLKGLPGIPQDKRFLSMKSLQFQDKGICEASMNSLSSIQTSQQDQALDNNEPRIIASFLLPYTIKRDPKDRTKLKLVTSIANPLFLYGALEQILASKRFNFKWVGLFPTKEELPQNEIDYIKSQLELKGCYPVFITIKQMMPYLNFYEKLMKPFFHNFRSLYEDYTSIENNETWKDFLSVNLKISQKIIEVKNLFSNQGIKQIWVHGDHLIMVPLYIKKAFSEANLGFFFHTPFPSTGIFKVFQFRYEILNSLLLCDLVGFHIFEYARNFIMTCHRLLNLDYEFSRGGYLGINNHGKNVMIRVSHAGIDERFVEDLMKQNTYRRLAKAYQRQFKEFGVVLKQQPIIISSIDHYHPITGIKNKLYAYQEFLRKYPNYRNQITLIQYCAPIIQAMDMSIEEYNQIVTENISVLLDYRREVRDLVLQIQEEFGSLSIIYQEENPPCDKRLSLWTESNILLVSSLKDGLCLAPLEFTACKKISDKMDSCLMILSELCGANRAFTGFLEFNPFNIQEFLMKLDQGLCMTSKEKVEMMKQAYSYVEKTSTVKWAESFLKDLKQAHKPSSVSYYLGDVQIPQEMNLRVIHSKTGLRKINLQECTNSFQNSNHCVIFIDHQALPVVDYAKDSMKPTKDVLADLEEISLDSRNTLIIFSNESKELMKEYFQDQVDNVWLVAESGYTFNMGDGTEWKKLINLGNKVWVNTIQEIMQIYTENIDGAILEERESTLVWNYMNAAEEQGNIAAKELYAQIKTLLGNIPVEIIQGKGYIEVKPVKLKKRKLVKYLLSKLSQNQKIDFLLYIGSDTGNEVVYNYLKQQKYWSHYCSLEDHKRYLCTIGKRPSNAQYYLDDVSEITLLINKLRHATQKRKKTRSYSDLKKISPLNVKDEAHQRVDRSSSNLAAFFYQKMKQEAQLASQKEDDQENQEVDEAMSEGSDENLQASMSLDINQNQEVQNSERSQAFARGIESLAAIDNQNDTHNGGRMRRSSSNWAELLPNSPRKKPSQLNPHDPNARTKSLFAHN